MTFVIISTRRRKRRSLAAALRKLGARVTDVDTVMELPDRPFAAVVLDRMSRYDLEALHARNAAVIDISSAEGGQDAACEILLQTAGLCLARRNDIVSNDCTMRGERGLAPACVRILVLEDHEQLRASLVRSFRSEASRRSVAVDVHACADLDVAVKVSQQHVIDVVIVDVCLGDGRPQQGLVFLEQLREQGFAGRAFVLTGMRDYDVEAKADALGARYIPKDNLNAEDFIARVFQSAGIAPAHASSVRLKGVSREDVATYLAHEPDGLHTALSRARSDAVRAIVLECAGNRTAAARRLRMTRQQVQTILDANGPTASKR